ncbi:MAG: histidine phosphatase family protein [Planctomycetota bacterium]|nr:histidine phosphatase family protein [Planctomycetota bacterium]
MALVLERREVGLYRLVPMELKQLIQDRLWAVCQAEPRVLSATLTGSFLTGSGLEGVSDIDFVLIVDRLDRELFGGLQERFDAALRGPLAELGWGLRINPTLGPLKFNDERTAVLHLMLYSREAHVDHAIQSPFTVLDWQRSPAVRGKAMQEVYPVFSLQPRHFFGARRSAKDYLRDLIAGEVSYRELICDDEGYREEKRGLPMGVRDAHEFGYHIVRFLMQNLVKLVERRNDALASDALLERYHAAFPRDASENASLFRGLERRKRLMDFRDPEPDLISRVARFVTAFEDQFREAFDPARAGGLESGRGATRHILMRHAPTPMNAGELRFVGRSDPDLLPDQGGLLQEAARAVLALGPFARAVASPLGRARQTLEGVLKLVSPGVPLETDERLIEIDYGACEGLTVGEARSRFPDLFRAFERGEDARFPGEGGEGSTGAGKTGTGKAGAGENSAMVAARAMSFVRECLGSASAGPTLVCTHNVVLRTVIGELLGVPRERWHLLTIPHAAPLCVLRTRFGCFLDLDPALEKQIFARFVAKG